MPPKLPKKPRRSSKPKPKPKPPPSRTPHLCQIIAWDPGKLMGFAVLSFGGLTHYYGGEELPSGLIRHLVDHTDLPTVGVIEEHVPHGKWGQQSYRRLQQRAGMAENELMSHGVRRIVRVFPQTWRAAFKIRGNSSQCKALAKALALSLYGEKDELPADLSLDVYEAALMATWAERSWQVAEALAA